MATRRQLLEAGAAELTSGLAGALPGSPTGSPTGSSAPPTSPPTLKSPLHDLHETAASAPPERAHP